MLTSARQLTGASAEAVVVAAGPRHRFHLLRVKLVLGGCFGIKPRHLLVQAGILRGQLLLGEWFSLAGGGRSCLNSGYFFL